ncbi:hypothetical protein AAFF_G00214430 [Aldrovandia affinis]|uniref:Ig-like domain-containing protein n=1 Tax=Aldrovandia affinis TaxID=143900 RepID=A0AAD7RGG7_9TELE|nr:hypothetical protein AAFF_G00214430 [Aldrovandia affinis]
MGSLHMLIVISALTDFCYPQPPLEIVQSPPALVQPEGSRCTLHCSARGVTDGAISWYRLDAGGGLRPLVKSLAPGFHGSPGRPLLGPQGGRRDVPAAAELAGQRGQRRVLLLSGRTLAQRDDAAAHKPAAWAGGGGGGEGGEGERGRGGDLKTTRRCSAVLGAEMGGGGCSRVQPVDTPPTVCSSQT